MLTETMINDLVANRSIITMEVGYRLFGKIFTEYKKATRRHYEDGAPCASDWLANLSESELRETLAESSVDFDHD